MNRLPIRCQHRYIYVCQLLSVQLFFDVVCPLVASTAMHLSRYCYPVIQGVLRVKIDTKLLIGVGFVIISASCVATGILTYELGQPSLQLSAFLIVLGIGTLLFGYYVLHSIYRPIYRLIDILDRISRGETDADIPERVKERNDEIGDLAQAFDRILTSLKLALQRTSPQLEAQIDNLENKVLMERDQYQALYDELPLPTFAILPDGTISMVNDAATDLLGYDRSALTTEHIATIHPDTAESEQLIEQAIGTTSSGESLTMELPFQKADGTTFQAVIHSAPVLDEDGQVTHIRAILTDYE